MSHRHKLPLDSILVTQLPALAVDRVWRVADGS
jgi:hypothetical protein